MILTTALLALSCIAYPGDNDRKTSQTSGPAFAVFDNQAHGNQFTTGPCTQDNECKTSCCNGIKCRSPDALKGDETCRSGLSPDFTNGLKFVMKPVSPAPGSPAPSLAVVPLIPAVSGDVKSSPKCNAVGAPKTSPVLPANSPSISPNPLLVNPAGPQFQPDRKTSILNPAFAPFDNLPFGTKTDTAPCTADAECLSSCCDGIKCRAPDALKNADTCRNGLAPDFSNGLKFVMKPMSVPSSSNSNSNPPVNSSASANTPATPSTSATNTNASANQVIVPAVNNGAPDRKTSAMNPSFAPFDNLPFGNQFTTGPCSLDAQCRTSCCDGKFCRAPDALKLTQTCRNGLAPDFTNGLVFVMKPMSDPSLGGAIKGNAV